MGGEWMQTTLGEFCPFAYGKNLPEKKREKGPYRVYGSNGPVGFHNKPLVEESGIVIGRKGTVGAVHYTAQPFWPIDTTFYVTKAEHRNLRYTYYLLKSLGLEYMNADSAVPGLNRDAAHARKILVPELDEQRAIAHILGTLDDKIELNRKMNETLEAMARAIFKCWFIDFEPVIENALRAGNPVPEAFRERAEQIRRRLAQNQPSSPVPFSRGEKGRNYRSGYDFTGLVEKARELRRKQTTAEELFWELVRNRQFMGLKFRRQHQIGDYIADFYCHEHRLVVELDGGIHKTTQKKDHKRDAWMKAQGFKVLRFTNEQLLSDPESVLNEIASNFQHLLPFSPFGRSTTGKGSMDEILPSPSGRGAGGEGLMDAIHQLFSDSFEDSELGKIPRGWKVTTIGSEFDLTMGQSPPGSTYNEEGEGLPFFQGRRDFGFRYPLNRVYCTAPTRIAHAGDTMVSVRAPVGDVNMAYETCCVGRGVAAVRHKSGSRSYTYYAMLALGERFKSYEAEGTVFGAITKKDFHNIHIVVPPSHLIKRFEEMIFPMDQRIDLNERQSNNLASIRDALLPKLLSGEIRAKDAERFVEASL